MCYKQVNVPRNSITPDKIPDETVRRLKPSWNIYVLYPRNMPISCRNLQPFWTSENANVFNESGSYLVDVSPDRKISPIKPEMVNFLKVIIKVLIHQTCFRTHFKNVKQSILSHAFYKFLISVVLLVVACPGWRSLFTSKHCLLHCSILCMPVILLQIFIRHKKNKMK